MKTSKTINEFCNFGIVRNYYTGSGCWIRKSADYVQKVLDWLKDNNIPQNCYISGNDAPRLGWSGYYVKLTEEGKDNPAIKAQKAEYQILEDKRKAKEAKLHEKENKAKIAKLPELCRERLTINISKNHKKRLNTEIRSIAKLAGLDCPLEQAEYLEFIKKQAEL